MPESNTTAEEAAELRRALVRFLVEASVEDTSQAKVANELLHAVRAVPAQNAEQLAGLEHRIDKLAAELQQLAAAVRTGAAGPGAQSAPNARGLVSGIAAGVITGIAAALLTATLLAGSVPGWNLKPRAAVPAALGTSMSPAAQRVQLVSTLTPPASTDGATRVAALATDGAPAAWEDLWGRMLAAPVSSCAAGGGVALRKCVCPARSDQACTLAQAQSVPGGPVMVAQALIKVRSPSLIQSREEIDGRLGPATVRALVKLTRGCGQLGKMAQQLAQESKSRGGFDADRALEPILAGLSLAPQCVEEPPP